MEKLKVFPSCRSQCLGGEIVFDSSSKESCYESYHEVCVYVFLASFNSVSPRVIILVSFTLEHCFKMWLCSYMPVNPENTGRETKATPSSAPRLTLGNRYISPLWRFQHEKNKICGDFVIRFEKNCWFYKINFSCVILELY